MSLWTPGGEHPVGRGAAGAEPEARGTARPELGPEEAARAEQLAHELAAARQRLLEAPVSAVLVNHALGIYELAAIHLAAERPRLGEAQLAIDALHGLVEATTGRLGDQEKTLRDALHQLRLAFVSRRSHSTGPAGPDAAGRAEAG
jgi:hypothetical protein